MCSSDLLIAFLWNFLRDPFFLFILGMLIKESIEWATSILIYGVGGGIPGPVVVFNWKALVFAIMYLLLSIAWAILWQKVSDFEFKPLRFKMITYPDCELCGCDEEAASTGGASSPSASPRPNTILINFSEISSYADCISDGPCLSDKKTDRFEIGRAHV